MERDNEAKATSSEKVQCSASAREQEHYAERLRRRAETMGGTVVEGDVVDTQVALTSDDVNEHSVALPSHTVEPDWRSTTHAIDSDRHLCLLCGKHAIDCSWKNSKGGWTGLVVRNQLSRWLSQNRSYGCWPQP